MPESAEKIQILVVDDSPVYRKLVEHAVCEDSYSLLFAKSGQEALDLFALHFPPIVITDWLMPDFSGLELCQRIREGASKRYTYLIVLTGKTEKDNVVKGLAAGADDYLTKPFDPRELMARIGVGRRIIDLHREIDAKNRQLEELAHTDPLTGLPNRRAVQEWAARQLKGAARHRFSFWVIQADLDRFKQINDKHGHQAGDVVLRKFADVLRNNTRASDICGRMGGDEFLVVITHADEEQIRLIVERFRNQFAEAVKSLDLGPDLSTSSFGVARFEGRDAPSFEFLVSKADEALYEAKHAGGNQFKLAAISGAV